MPRMRIASGADAQDRPHPMVPRLPAQRADGGFQVSEYGAKHHKEMHDGIDEDESGWEQFVKLGLWSIAMILFGALLIFGLDKLESLGRKPMAPITAPH